MEVQLALIFTFSVHLCHLFQRLEHGLNDFLVSAVNACAYFEAICTNKLVLHVADVDRKVLDEVNYAFAFFASQFCLLDPFDLLILHA